MKKCKASSMRRHCSNSAECKAISSTLIWVSFCNLEEGEDEEEEEEEAEEEEEEPPPAEEEKKAIPQNPIRASFPSASRKVGSTGNEAKSP